MILNCIHPSWEKSIARAYAQLSVDFQAYLAQGDFLPKHHTLLAAFSLPREAVRIVLIGESPYPRTESANGYAFWDGAVDSLWSEQGLSKSINRATSLRNFMKMLLNAQGLLKAPFTPQAIAAIEKTDMPQTLSELFQGMLNQGFLLLNASLTWSKDKPVSWHAKNWYAFNHNILKDLLRDKPEIQILLFGKVAEKFKDLPQEKCIIAEHPYVLSFIENPKILNFFQNLNLLRVAHV